MRVIHFLVNYSSNLFIECHTSSSPTNVIIETDHIWNHAGKIGSKLESAPVIDVEEPQIRLQLLPVSIKHIFVIQSWITLSVNPLLFGTIIQKWEKVCLDGLFLTSAVSWVGLRAKVTGSWNCYKENLAAHSHLKITLNYDAKYTESHCQETVADMHIKSTVTFFPRRQLSSNEMAQTQTQNILWCARRHYRKRGL